MDITLVYFIYGLAFFSLGLAMLFESGRSPLLSGAGALLPLAIFGLVHGAHEWMEMFLGNSEWLVISNPALIGWVRISVLAISFSALLVFGLRMIAPASLNPGRRRWVWAAAILFYIALVVLIVARPWSVHSDNIAHIDGALRYFLAIPSAAIAGVAFYRLARQVETRRGRGVVVGLLAVAWCFLIYALTQAVVPPLDVFPANVLNTAVFMEWFGFPVQVVRAAVAIGMTTCLVLIVRANEYDRQRQFTLAQQERLAALEQVHQELMTRESMRQELMRHIVVAQEDERARISRELHDETSQILTAISFHLAALRREAAQNPKAREQVDYLQGLSRQMAQGLYRMVHDLRPSQLDDLGLAAALHYLISEEKSHMALEIDFKIYGERRRLDPLVETVLFRVAQEALTNITRHAQSRRASVELTFGLEQAGLMIKDEGIGFDPQQVFTSGGAWGLAGMRERCESIGARLTLDSAPGLGTRIEVTVPLAEKAADGLVEDQVDRLAEKQAWKQFA